MSLDGCRRNCRNRCQDPPGSSRSNCALGLVNTSGNGGDGGDGANGTYQFGGGGRKCGDARAPRGRRYKAATVCQGGPSNTVWMTTNAKPSALKDSTPTIPRSSRR